MLAGATLIGIGVIVYPIRRKLDLAAFDPSEFARQMGSAAPWLVFGIIQSTDRGRSPFLGRDRVNRSGTESVSRKRPGTGIVA